MARHTRRHRRSRRHRHKHRGGYSSASTYGMHVSGTSNSQWARTMDQSGPYGNVQGNNLIGTSGEGVIPTSRMPTASNMALIQSGGRRRKRHGGFLGEVVNQAVTPLTLLALQQTYKRKKRGGRQSRRRHRRGGSLNRPNYSEEDIQAFIQYINQNYSKDENKKNWLLSNINRMPYETDYQPVQTMTDPTDPYYQGLDRISAYVKYGDTW